MEGGSNTRIRQKKWNKYEEENLCFAAVLGCAWTMSEYLVMASLVNGTIAN